jgi:hypothetical protein
VVGRPVEQIVNEVEQAAVRPLQILEREDHGVLLGHPLQEQPPATKQVRTVSLGTLLEP